MDRSDYLQEWNFEPVRKVPDDAPQPWFIAGYSFKAVDNVLRVDYGAVRKRDGVYHVPNGSLIYIGFQDELHGRQGGTMFVLFYPHYEVRGTLDRIIETAASRGMKIEGLASGPIVR